ncbi:hypothetical protein BW731_04320 [Vagococcus martis]|uniref:HTH merR-type domain-containing protein n=1 Tax=Vagococcus martis TaxID=1768210 RepID=A0A1V4DG09_9ENTE|nr:MerR family transcriptional regulator [Vagococcus martis]OPF87484.1 hypothetical protein BW731_04320 [Vagococcus martis]
MEYSIGELAELVGMTSHGLRFYEKEGLISPKRKGKNRVYSEEDRLWVEFLMHMKDTGMSLQDMKQYVVLRKQDNPSLKELMSILVTHRNKINEQILNYQQNLDLLDKKIAVYEEEIDQKKEYDLFEEFMASHG